MTKTNDNNVTDIPMENQYIYFPATRIGLVTESLKELQQQYIDIDIKSLSLCTEIIQRYADRFIPYEGTASKETQELQTVISLLNHVSTDMNTIRDAFAENVKSLGAK